MRIIGGHDIYDGPAADWHDDLVWNRGDGRPDKAQEKVLRTIAPTNARESYVLAGSRPRLIRSDRIQAGRDMYSIYYPVLFLCGKIHRGIRLNSVQEELFFWRKEAFEAWLEEKNLEKRRTFAGETNYPFETSELTPNQERPFLDARIVLAWATHRSHDSMHWQVNTEGLRHLEIGKLMPPAEIAQEIIRYVGSRMVEPDPAKITVSEDIRLAKHGMDKTSFRKPAGTKKRGKA